MHSDLSIKIHRLQAKNQSAMLTSVAVLIAALFVTALLPSLLIQYVYAGQQLLKQPVLLEYIPIVSFVLGLGTFLVAAVGNAFRAKRIMFLEKQVETEGCSSCCCYEDDDDVLAELESLAEALVEEKKPAKKKPAKKKPAKKKSPKAKK